MNGDFAVRQLEFDREQLVSFAAEVMTTVRSHPEYFLLNTKRETYAPALKDTRTIHLRHAVFPHERNVTTRSTQHAIECVDDPLLNSDFQSVKLMVQQVGRAINGDSGFYKHGRYFITMLKAGEHIGEHVDAGAYFKYYRRFHIPLEVNGACFFACGERKAVMTVGGLYELNNCIPHLVDNTGGQDRYHLIFDCI